MQIYKAPLKDTRFALEALDYDKIVPTMEAFEDYDLEMVMALLEQVGTFCTKELLPLNRLGDQQGVTYDPETYSVKTPDGFPELYKKFSANGMHSLTGPVEYGGSGAPHLLGVSMSEMTTAANKSLSMCPGLTHGLIHAIHLHGTQEQKDFYLNKLVPGEWAGTMCLTEPHSGTDLGLISTRAKVAPDGDGYLLNGTKIWITFGEHDLTPNIIHLVLGRLPDAPKGIKGISLFVVPKMIGDVRNPIFCTGLEHKLGIHASPTCVISMEDARGWLVGEPHKGMRAMFSMMNVARLNVGMEGIGLGEIAYQTALSFAKDRRQSRSLNPERQEKSASADCIMVHPDVRRMLLNIKATNEGMRGLTLWLGINLDISHHHPDKDARQAADDLCALLTPVVKSFCTEIGFNNVNTALQVTGGAGYTTDWSIEQYLRDLRIALIYEGTNHIQALDLVGRKLPRGGGRLYQVFNGHITSLIRDNSDVEGMQEFLTPLKAASKKLMNVTMELSMKGMQDAEIVGAVASDYLNVFGYTAVAYSWCVQAKFALTRDDKFAKTKLKTARYYFNNVLPEMDTLIAKISVGKGNIMDFDVEEF